ncbi:MAG: hypothetical protein R3F43_13855 [bacterium]
MLTQTVMAALSLLLAARADQRDVLFQALADELQRNQQQLALDDHGAPYYIGYRLVERESVVVEARFGAVVEDERSVDRRAAVDVRVGDYTFDSAPEPDDTSMIFEDLTGFRPRKEAPVDDDPGSLRATFWLLTDQAYKGALSTYLRKQARKVTTVEDKHVDSFSREKPATQVDAPVYLAADAEAWRGQARRLSARFRTAGRLLDGSVRSLGERTRTYLVTRAPASSRSTSSTRWPSTPRARPWTACCWSRARRSTAPPPTSCPPRPPSDALITRCLTTSTPREGPLADPYDGACHLEPEAMGVFFHETIGHHAGGCRTMTTRGAPSRVRVGQAIIPEVHHRSRRPDPGGLPGYALNGHSPSG